MKRTKKQLYKLKRDLIYNMQKTLKPKKVYPHENDTNDYYYPSIVPSHPPAQEYTETYTQPSVPPPQQQQQPTQSTQKYCFL